MHFNLNKNSPMVFVVTCSGDSIHFLCLVTSTMILLLFLPNCLSCLLTAFDEHWTGSLRAVDISVETMSKGAM